MEPTPETPELPVVRQEEDMWILRVETNGKVQEYRCHTELQARALDMPHNGRKASVPETGPQDPCRGRCRCGSTYCSGAPEQRIRRNVGELVGQPSGGDRVPKFLDDGFFWRVSAFHSIGHPIPGIRGAVPTFGPALPRGSPGQG